MIGQIGGSDPDRNWAEVRTLIKYLDRYVETKPDNFLIICIPKDLRLNDFETCLCLLSSDIS